MGVGNEVTNMTQTRYAVIRVLSEVALYQLRNGSLPTDVWAMVGILAKHFGLDSQDQQDIERAVNEAQVNQWPCTAKM
jgi:hypothetical protein